MPRPAKPLVYRALGLPVCIVLGYMAAAIFIYLLESASLITGAILMMFVGPLWISLVLNLMLLHLAVAALGGQILRLWLILPIAAYGATWAYYFHVQNAQTSP